MTLTVGVVTIAAGLFLILRHLHVWRSKIESGVDSGMRKFLDRQLRRRCLIGLCMAVLGFTIAAMYFKDFWRERPAGLPILLSCSLALVFMIMVLAFLDFAASATALRSQSSETRAAAEALAKEYVRLRTKKKILDQDSSARKKSPEKKS